MKRSGTILGVLALVAGILAFAAPAQAAVPFKIQQFMPNDTQVTTSCSTSPGCLGDFLSDKFDGVDSVAHLTAVATTDTTQVTWYACPVSTPDTPTNADLANCTITIGTDDSGVTPPVGPTASAPADEAYDVTWDIPDSLDQQKRDIMAVACVGTAQQVSGASQNCRANVQHNIFLENAQSGTAQNQTTSGEFGQVRTNPACFNATTEPCNASYIDFPHGAPVPNDGFDFRAFTSDEVAFLQWTINAASAQAEPSNSNFVSFGNCTVEQTGTNFKRWRCAVSSGNVPDDTGIALTLLEANGGGSLAQGSAGYCNANNNPSASPQPQNVVAGAHDACVLDVHYVESSPRTATTVVQSFAPNPPSPLATAGCDNPDTQETSVVKAETEDVTLCLRDQFGDPFNGPWTEETTGVGEIADCGPEGTAHDHDGDGKIDDCVGTTGADGTVTGITIANPTGPKGTQTLTSCFDQENATTNPPVTDHGCADESIKGSISDTWTYLKIPVSISLVHQNSPHVFKGRITSSAVECKDGRPVKIKKKKAGPDPTVESAVSKTDGTYSVKHQPNGKGKFYAKVGKFQFEGATATSQCVAAQSGTVSANK